MLFALYIFPFQYLITMTMKHAFEACARFIPEQTKINCCCGYYIPAFQLDGFFSLFFLRSRNKYFRVKFIRQNNRRPNREGVILPITTLVAVYWWWWCCYCYLADSFALQRLMLLQVSSIHHFIDHLRAHDSHLLTFVYGQT